MSDGRHDCPRDGCTNRVPSEMFCCRSHWYSLPKPIRDDVWHAYRRWSGGRADYSELAAAHSRALAHWGQK